jgi:hypothetical protein
MNQVATIPQDQPLAIVSDGASLMNAIAQAARDPDCDVDKMERLMAMRREIQHEQAEAEFNQAMTQVQTAMRRVGADKRNSQTNSDYATYAKLDRYLRPLYTAEGFALSFGTEESPIVEMVRVVCHVSHRGGFTRKYLIDMPADGKGAKGNDVMTKTHATGSATQYGMRYLLKMIFNVAIGEDPDDDDGNNASQIDQKAADWIHVAKGLERLEDYDQQKAKVLADYGGKASSLPPEVRTEFNLAKARVTPKD